MPVDERNWLAQRFEEHRSHLRAVAYRMLGSASEADDAVQEAWLRLDRSDTSAVENPGAARQLASRARRRVQGATAAPSPDRTRQRKVVDAFLAASRNGDFNALLAVLHPGVVLRADPAAVRMGAAAEIHGAKPVAETFRGRAQAAQSALVNGAAGLVWIAGGQPRVVFQFTTAGAKIVAIDMIADAERLRQLDLLVLNS